jgi:hypothetical protein
MKQITIHLDPYAAYFYQKIADTYGLPLEQVLCDALFKLAGELSLEAIYASEKRQHPPS